MKDTMWVKELIYLGKPINEKFYDITYQDEETKKERYKLWNEIHDKGKYISCGWFGDYYISTYKYNDKYYQLAENMELGIMSYIKEYELEEVK